MTKTGILLIHFHNSLDTLDCLDSLAAAEGMQESVVYILNVQGDEAAALKHHPLKPVIVNESRNLGFSGGNNRLIKTAIADGCDRLILLNNDTIVAKDFLKPLLSQLENPRVGMVCPKIYFYKGCEFHRDSYTPSEVGKVIWYAGGVIDWKNVTGFHWGVDEVDHGQFADACETMYATGCCVAVRAEMIQKAGSFDEAYFLYYEDADWSMRVRNAGYKIMLEPNSVIWHKNAGSTSGAGSSMHVYYQTRNRFLFGMKYAPVRIKYHLLRQYMGYLSQADPTMVQAAADALTGHYGIKRSRGRNLP